MNFKYNEITKKTKILTSKSGKYQKKFQVTLFRLLLLLLLSASAFIIGTGIGIFREVLSKVPDINSINVKPSGFSSIIYDKYQNEIQTLSDFNSNREEVSLNEVPENVKNAFIAIEDSRFYEHHGIDVKGIIRALFQGITTKNFSQGASTITQQLLKNNVFGVGNEKNWKQKVERKIQEQYLAIKLEKKMNKNEILEAYLNTINLGEGTLGVQAASKTYFDKKVSDLTLAESSVLAAITQNPTKYNPISNPEENQKRRLIVLKYMFNEGMIREKEYKDACSLEVYDEIQDIHKKHNAKSASYSYFVDSLIQQVIKDLEEKCGYNETQAYNALYSEGLQIYSTQNTAIQQICDEEIQNEANYNNSKFASKYALSYQLSVKDSSGKISHYSEKNIAEFLGYSSAEKMYFQTKKEGIAAARNYKESILKKGMTVLGENISLCIEPQISYTLIEQSTGYVTALVGGRGEKNGNLTLNRATDMTKQPGSTFKVLSTFVPALDTAGLTLATVYDDCPYYYENSTKAVNNYYSTYRGLSSIRDAIRDSMNVVTAKCMADVTPQVGFDYLKNLGFTTLVDKKVGKDGTIYSDIQQSLCLGGITKGVTNLELTSGYAAIANGGAYNRPILYTKILDHKGNVLIDNTSESTQVMKETTAWLLTNAMKDVVTSGTGTMAALNDGMAVAGKTGTTSNDYDHWFVGYTPYYTAGIWCGYDSNQSFLSGGIEKKIWSQIMQRVIQCEGETPKDFKQCDGIVTASICKKCGKLAVPKLCDKDPRGNMIATEFFAEGTVPTENCTCHTKVTICKDSNLPATDQCPKENTEKKVYIVRPEGSIGTTLDTQYELPAQFVNSHCNIHGNHKLQQKTEDNPDKKNTAKQTKKN